MKSKATRRLSYDDQKARIKEFLINHDDFDSSIMDDHYGRKKYMIRLVLFSLLSKPSPTKRPTPSR